MEKFKTMVVHNSKHGNKEMTALAKQTCEEKVWKRSKSKTYTRKNQISHDYKNRAAGFEKMMLYTYYKLISSILYKVTPNKNWKIILWKPKAEITQKVSKFNS